jgi:hypothetical protein
VYLGDFMQDFTKEQLQANISPDDAEPWLEHVLEALYTDTEHRTSDGVVENLSFEELIGALIAAQLRINELERQEASASERFSIALDALTPEQLAKIEIRLRAITATYM